MLAWSKRPFQNNNPFTILIGGGLAENNIAFKDGYLGKRLGFAGEHCLAVGRHLRQIDFHGRSADLRILACRLAGAAILLRIIRSVGCCLLIGRGVTGGRDRCRHELAIFGLWFDRIGTAIIKKNDSQRHHGYGGPDTDQDVCQQPHANPPFHWLKTV